MDSDHNSAWGENARVLSLFRVFNMSRRRGLEVKILYFRADFSYLMDIKVCGMELGGYVCEVTCC